jgi:UDP-N-acetylglucosamine 4,6-dehydratase/5-epimerase
MLNRARVLVTGGTGSFGQAFVNHVLSNDLVSEVIVFSRDEFKQHEMARRWPVGKYPIRYFLGDIRDRDRLMRAFNGVNYIVHAAALKQVPAIEQNPFEAIRTNIIGAENIVEAALERGVRRVVAVSTDKAVNPLNLYGATKLAMEKLMLAANTYARYRDVRFSIVRYGNVIGSRGSVLQVYADLVAQGTTTLPVTDPTMTRFWITLDRGVQLVLRALEDAQGGETFVPKIPSMSVGDLVSAMPVACSQLVIGRRPGEKLHEALIGEGEGYRAVDRGDHYVIMPEAIGYKPKAWAKTAPKMPADFVYTSDTNSEWVSVDEMRKLIMSMIDESSKMHQLSSSLRPQ